MRALRLHEHGGPEQLRYEDRAPVPPTTTGDVLIAVHAASFTPGELDWPSTWVDRSGHDRRPVVPCHEVSGVVEALGFGAAGLCVGDEVYGLTDWYRDGAAADYVAVEARNLARKPASLDHVAAATIPLAGLTAWQGAVPPRRAAARPDRPDPRRGRRRRDARRPARAPRRRAGRRDRAAGRRGAGDRARRRRLRRRRRPGVRRPGPGSRSCSTSSAASCCERSWPLVEPGGAVVSIAEPPDAQEAARRGVDRDVLRRRARPRGPGRADRPDRRGRAARRSSARPRPDEQAPAAIAAKERGGTAGKLALQVR